MGREELVSKIAVRAEILANLAILVVAVLVGGILARNYFFASGFKEPRHIQAGTTVSLPDVDWAKNGQTLVLALRRGCHFCSESAPFYQRLARQLAGRSDIRLLVVLPETIEEGQKYLNELGVPINEIRQAQLNSIEITGTPTLILVDSKGVVTDSWIGKLAPDKESEVFGKLQCRSCS